MEEELRGHVLGADVLLPRISGPVEIRASIVDDPNSLTLSAWHSWMCVAKSRESGVTTKESGQCLDLCKTGKETKHLNHA